MCALPWPDDSLDVVTSLNGSGTSRRRWRRSIACSDLAAGSRCPSGEIPNGSICGRPGCQRSSNCRHPVSSNPQATCSASASREKPSASSAMPGSSRDAAGAHSRKPSSSMPSSLPVPSVRRDHPGRQRTTAVRTSFDLASPRSCDRSRAPAPASSASSMSGHGSPRGVSLVDVVPDPPTRYEKVPGAPLLRSTNAQKADPSSTGTLCCASRGTRACHDPEVRVFTWRVTRRVWLASLAMMSMPGMLPAKVTA
jgi:hypothetical protein